MSPHPERSRTGSARTPAAQPSLRRHQLRNASLAAAVVVGLPLLWATAHALGGDGRKEAWPVVSMPAFARTATAERFELVTSFFLSRSCDDGGLRPISLSQVLDPLPASQQRRLVARCFPHDGTLGCPSAHDWFAARIRSNHAHCGWGVVIEERTMSADGQVLERREAVRHLFDEGGER